MIIQYPKDKRNRLLSALFNDASTLHHNANQTQPTYLNEEEIGTEIQAELARQNAITGTVFIKALRGIPLNIVLYDKFNEINATLYYKYYGITEPTLTNDTQYYEYHFYKQQPHLRIFYFNGETLRFLSERELATYPYLTPTIVNTVHRNEARLIPNKIPYQLTISDEDPMKLIMFSFQLTQKGIHHAPRLLINTVPCQLIIESKSDVNLHTISSQLTDKKIPYTIKLTPNTIPDHLIIKCNNDTILDAVEEELIAKKIPHYVENRYSLFTASQPSIIVITGHDVKTLQDEHISHPHSTALN